MIMVQFSEIIEVLMVIYLFKLHPILHKLSNIKTSSIYKLVSILNMKNQYVPFQILINIAQSRSWCIKF